MNRILWALTAPLALAVFTSALQADDVKSDGLRIVRGKVSAIRPNEITVVPRRGEPVKVRVDENQMRDVKEGTRVRVQYETRNDVNRAVALDSTASLLERTARFLAGGIDTATTYAYNHREEYRRRLENAVHELDDQIADLEERAEEATAAARPRVQKDIETLQEKRRELNRRLERVRSATADTWSEIQAGASAVAADIQQTIERIRQRNASDRR